MSIQKLDETWVQVVTGIGVIQVVTGDVLVRRGDTLPTDDVGLARTSGPDGLSLIDNHDPDKNIYVRAAHAALPATVYFEEGNTVTGSGGGVGSASAASGAVPVATIAEMVEPDAIYRLTAADGAAEAGLYYTDDATPPMPTLIADDMTGTATYGLEEGYYLVGAHDAQAVVAVNESRVITTGVDLNTVERVYVSYTRDFGNYSKGQWFDLADFKFDDDLGALLHFNSTNWVGVRINTASLAAGEMIFRSAFIPFEIKRIEFYAKRTIKAVVMPDQLAITNPDAPADYILKKNADGTATWVPLIA